MTSTRAEYLRARHEKVAEQLRRYRSVQKVTESVASEIKQAVRSLADFNETEPLLLFSHTKLKKRLKQACEAHDIQSAVRFAYFLGRLEAVEPVAARVELEQKEKSSAIARLNREGKTEPHIDAAHRQYLLLRKTRSAESIRPKDVYEKIPKSYVNKFTSYDSAIRQLRHLKKQWENK